MCRSSLLLTGVVLLYHIGYTQPGVNQRLTVDTTTLAPTVSLNPASTGTGYSTFTPQAEPLFAGRIPHYNTRRRKPPAEVYSFTAVTSGVWIPTGWNDRLGVHPALGMIVGVWSNRMLYQLNTEFRFLDAANSYTVMYEGAPLTQKKYFGGYLGMHVGYAVVCMPMNTVYVLTGCAYDGFDAVDGDDTHQALTINSLNVNFGAGIHHFGKKGGLLGVELTYDIINYNNPGGTPLNGNAITLRLSVGFLE
jgi:hypothetical protein